MFHHVSTSHQVSPCLTMFHDVSFSLIRSHQGSSCVIMSRHVSSCLLISHHIPSQCISCNRISLILIIYNHISSWFITIKLSTPTLSLNTKGDYNHISSYLISTHLIISAVSKYIPGLDRIPSHHPPPGPWVVEDLGLPNDLIHHSQFTCINTQCSYIS
jgi:hypothetical protein